MASHIGRRKFLATLGGTAAWPLTARAQQPAMPVIGVLDARSPGTTENPLRAFREGLKDAGYIAGENVALEYRWAEDQVDRLPALAADLVQRRATVIAAISPTAVLAAKAAIATTPIVFIVNEDPVRPGLVASLARPGGNLTGINILTAEVTAKRLDLLRELMPSANRVGVLVNPVNAPNTETTLREMAAAAHTTGLQLKILNASTSREIEAAFASLLHERPDALFVGAEPYFYSRRVQLAVLAASHRLPAIYAQRAFVEAGGLMSYGTNIADAFRQIGVYAGRILKGAKPADLPVVQASKFELVVNLPTARALGLEVPPMLLARADEVIE
jgi:putative ABC transport system substrate-binding protein